jgi:predicted pyridoxine 5'-phosphate oxidase superfamily flavin-nucleotide-binding protein
LADRLESLTVHTELDDGDIALIGDQAAVWVATVDAQGWPDVSYKGGDRGFVRVVSRHEVRLPVFNGNGMWRTLGNLLDDPRVALLFVDAERPWRLRLHGRAAVRTDEAATSAFVGAEAVLVVHVERAFPNCGRYIHQDGAISPFVPRADEAAPVPDWKRLPFLNEVLPADDPARDDRDEPGQES